MAETEFPLGPEIGIDQGTDFVPTELEKGPGLLKTLAPILGGAALGGVPGLLLAAFGASGAIGSAESRSRQNAFTELANIAEQSPQEALNNPAVLNQLGAQMMLDPSTAAQGQAFLQRAQQIQGAQAAETQRVATGEAGLRSELASTFKFGQLDQLAGNFQTARALFEEGSPTANTQLARILEKMIDPTGVVRPGDFTTIVGASSWATRMEQKLIAGEVPESLVPDLMRAIALVAQSRQRQFNQSTAPRFRDLALANELNPANVVFDPLQGAGVDEILQRIPIGDSDEPGVFGGGVNPEGTIAERVLGAITGG